MINKLEAAQQAFLGFAKRAEKVSTEILSDTFVDTAPLTAILSTPNSQILYGRRGTGKTHALLYLSSQIRGRGDHVVYLDLRSIGSDGSIYNDFSRSVAERSVRLILDVLKAFSIELFELIVQRFATHTNPSELAQRFEDFEASISEVGVHGEVTTSSRSSSDTAAEVGATASVSPSNLDMSLSGGSKSSQVEETARSATGRERFSLNFGRVQGTLRSLLAILGNPRVWVLIDEWSEVPVELQPHLADLFRRTFFPVQNIVVKIAAIEHRSSFFVAGESGSYVGFELGADISTDLNLDDFLVFDNDQNKSVDFFKRLLFRHLKASEFGEQFTSPDELIQTVFTQHPVFEELVRAAEGVPRDALNLAAKVATKAYGRAVSVADIRASARDWYQQDKAAPIQANKLLSNVLEKIVSEIIGNRKARAFLFKANTRHTTMDQLFDARVIHLLKKNISSHDNPGERYDAFKIDYGCYVELITTAKAPGGLFNTDDGSFVDVPLDDYRSIRRAILPEETLQETA
ncbi:hypothetical protein [Devosia sp.]|uniref:ORC-CDC6 family AAA ATPase n=1 Tax=Devosia sp. TaxID=1871048 RepID=UPI001B20B186|nr:hypothetical protein [Devosia sp.]MBO9589445.1 hypothetical protein [Devosia sp.]